ncbi:Maf family protein [Vallitalea sp.]|uniref:Maf family protein n=1 Tax=Vallitalea sp. TaxID=1882829 RepID=UPI0025CDDC78|nr:Maf family protein [Vallitalea sp.]MCT4688921.1 Maf family protein [Vallitalea sp.]
MKNIILASKSPRRKELLERLNLDFDVKVSNLDEDRFEQDLPWEFVEKLAYEKANSVSKLVDNDSLVIGCDTVVVYEDKILGKPKDTIQARDYLKKLSGKKHLVYSGIAILNMNSNNNYISHEVTEVYMKELNEEEITCYINTGEPLDKAGAYGIQGVGSIFIEKINGDYYNVMGLPLNKLYKGLSKLGVNYFQIVK